MITAVNPAIIQWARERSGLSLDDLSSLMKRDPVELQQWENGERAPSYTTLEDLAYRHFKIPIAVFFFPTPPNADGPKGSFRRLPEYELKRFSPDTIQKIRSAQAYQDSLEEFFIETPPERMIHHDINPRGYSLETLVAKVRNYLGISYKQQFAFQSNDQAFKAWRHACRKYSGRVGRSAAAKELDKEAVCLAVAAHVRHQETNYDELLLTDSERWQASEQVHAQVSHVLAEWQSTTS